MKRERSNKFRERLARSTRGPTPPTAMREGHAEPAAEMLAALDPMDVAQGERFAMGKCAKHYK